MKRWKMILAALAVMLFLTACVAGDPVGGNQTPTETVTKPGAATPTPTTKIDGKTSVTPETATPTVTEEPTKGQEPSTEPTPTGEITATPEVTLTPEVTPTPITYEPFEPEVLFRSVGVDSIFLIWSGNSVRDYVVRYRADGGGWNTVTAVGAMCMLEELIAGTEYAVQILEMSETADYTSETAEVWLDAGIIKTDVTGYGDPFRSRTAQLVLGETATTVRMTAVSGCFGAKIWPQHDCKWYPIDPELGALAEEGNPSLAIDLKGGTPLTVTETEEGGYCYLRTGNRWSLHVSGKAADGTEINGWVDADLMIVDVCDLFATHQNIYGVQINRTNASSSIFTAGGAVDRVDSTSAPETRYAILQNEETTFTDTGYNVIDSITGERLPKYGDANQMPLLWDVALELLQCQRNALATGTCLMIYEGYRPNSTSRAVYNSVVNNKYLVTEENGLTLAKGFAKANFGPQNYIARDSNHNRGTAMDLTLMAYNDAETLGEELKMQTKMHTLDFRCNMLYNNDAANLLYEIMMTGTHLTPLASKAEWWHFQMERNETVFPQITTYIFVDYEI